MTLLNSSAPKIEPSLSKNFFIWGNIALMAAIPWLLTQSMAGLAVGDPIFPDWFEIALLGLPAIALATWIHWIQPISPFSLWLIAKPSEKLNEQERRALTLISQPHNGWYVTGWMAIAVGVFMSAVFCKIYADSPLSQVIAPFPDELRFFGVLWAEVFFLLSNVLLQSGVSALRVKLAANSDLSSLTPFAPEKIKNSFTHIGWRSPQLFTNDQSDDQVDSTLESTLASISPETLTEEITNGIKEQELEVVEEVIEELDISDYKQEIAEEIVDVTEDIAIAEISPEISSEGTEVIDSTSSDFENELDELITFNLYVENILQDYLEKESLEDSTNNNPDDTNNDGVVDIIEITATSETATAIAEEVLIAEEILEEGIPEPVIDLSTVKIPEQAIDKNLSIVQSQEELQTPKVSVQSRKYLVEEFLVDKYLAKLEQLNKVEKNELEKNSSEQTNTTGTQPLEPKPVADEFADLDDIIDGKAIDGKTVTED